MSTLQILYGMIDSQNAEEAAIRRLVNIHPFINQDKALKPGILLYILDPMFCMGVEDYTGIEFFMDHPSLKKKLSKDEIDNLRVFLNENKPEIQRMIQFLEWLLDYQPREISREKVINQIEEQLIACYGAVDKEIIGEITDELYNQNKIMW
jgi:hypothetical protein